MISHHTVTPIGLLQVHYTVILRFLCRFLETCIATRDLMGVYSDTTQLNSTSSWVDLRRRTVYSDADATQLNSTAWTTVTDQFWTSWPSEGVYRRNSTQFNSTSSWVSWVASAAKCLLRPADTTQLDVELSWVELSCVAINGPLGYSFGMVILNNFCSLWRPNFISESACF